MKKLSMFLLSITLLVALAGCGDTKNNLDGTVELDVSIEEREESIGKSNKDFTEITSDTPSDVRNDVTGKWRKIRTTTSEDLLEYLLSYNKLHMTEDTTVHVIVNFTNKITVTVNDFGTYLNVSIYEHLDKEENDASRIGKGLSLGNYHIQKDNGDIIKLDY